MHDYLTHAEAAVLTTLHDSPDRWLDRATIELATGLSRRSIEYALHELERRQFACERGDRRRRQWSVTTTGETELARWAARAA